MISGELVRLLINHPDVDLRWFAFAGHPDLNVADTFTGLIGECDLKTIDQPLPEDADLIFLSTDSDEAARFLDSQDLPATLCVIDLSGSQPVATRSDEDVTDYTFGMPEMLRRRLVHECQRVSMPAAGTVATLLPLLPLAKNLLVNAPIHATITLGESVPNQSVERALEETKWALQVCQNSFDQPIEIVSATSDEPRLLATQVKLNCPLDSDLIRSLYEEYYDDHNFVFIVDRMPQYNDVASTNKCLMHLAKDEESGVLTIYACMDGLLKAGAGNALHIANLLKGLHERVGLTLKAFVRPQPVSEGSGVVS